jgi:hypothetical protein
MLKIAAERQKLLPCGIQKDDGKAEVPSGNHNTGP